MVINNLHVVAVKEEETLLTVVKTMMWASGGVVIIVIVAAVCIGRRRSGMPRGKSLALSCVVLIQLQRNLCCITVVRSLFAHLSHRLHQLLLFLSLDNCIKSGFSLALPFSQTHFFSFSLMHTT